MGANGTVDDGARTCSICNAPFNIDTEGGYEGLFGMIPFSFCVTCNTCVVDYVCTVWPDAWDDDD